MQGLRPVEEMLEAKQKAVMAVKEKNETARRHTDMEEMRWAEEEEGEEDRLHTYQGTLQRTPCLCLRADTAAKEGRKEGRSAAETVSAETGQRPMPALAVGRPHAGGGANSRSREGEPPTHKRTRLSATNLIDSNLIICC